MNKMRRSDIDDLITALEKLREKTEDILSAEQDYYDNMPENLQSSSRADAAEEAISNLEDAISSIEDAIGSLEEAKA